MSIPTYVILLWPEYVESSSLYTGKGSHPLLRLPKKILFFIIAFFDSNTIIWSCWLIYKANPLPTFLKIGYFRLISTLLLLSLPNHLAFLLKIFYPIAKVASADHLRSQSFWVTIFKIDLKFFFKGSKVNTYRFERE